MGFRGLGFRGLGLEDFLAGAPAMAKEAPEQLAVAGKSQMGLRKFRPSSQDGQYRPFDPKSSLTLRLDSLESNAAEHLAIEQGTLSPKAPKVPRALRLPPTRSLGYAARNPPAVSIDPNPTAKPLLAAATPSPCKKGWQDLPCNPKGFMRKSKRAVSPTASVAWFDSYVLHVVCACGVFLHEHWAISCYLRHTRQPLQNPVTLGRGRDPKAQPIGSPLIPPNVAALETIFA